MAQSQNAKRGPGRPRKNQQINEDTHKVEQTPKATSAEPGTEERAVRRRRRGSVGGFRNILTVRPKRASFTQEYETRWIKAETEKDNRLLLMYNADWDFVGPDEVEVGDNFVYKTGDVGSIVRVPAGDGRDSGSFLFLMKKRREWYEADQAELQKEIDKKEAYIDRKRNPDQVEDEGDGGTEGLYGGATTKFEPL